MHTGHHYSFLEVLQWTRRDIARHLATAGLLTCGFELLGLRWLAIPWQPIALLGTAVAFMVGFKNNASYDRLWEARRIWGAIVNASRSWGLMSRDLLSERHAKDTATAQQLEAARRALVERHFAWLTALRYQLREPRAWEAGAQRSNAEYRVRWFRVAEHNTPVDQALKEALPPEELDRVLGASNKAAQILALQSAQLAQIRAAGWVDDLGHLELQRVLSELLTQQGGSERIKNFPYPRQYATMNLWFINIFVSLVPLGMLQEFGKLGGNLIWLAIPFSALAGWVFTTMEKIGEASESPFEGSANDVPITAISRTIEIDLRQMLGERKVPAPIAAEHGILT